MQVESSSASRPRAPVGTPTLLAGVAIAAAALAAGLAFAYCRCFSLFRRYDDQGFLMLYLQHVLEGRPHYAYPEMVDIYGPWYYLVRCVPHGLLGLPLTTDNVRLLSVFFQLAAGVMLAIALAVLRAGRGGVFLAVACFACCVSHLQVFANEPGHAQEVIVLAISLCALLLAVVAPRPVAVCTVVGCATGIVLLSKANVGVFLALGGTVALGSRVPRTRFWLAAWWSALGAALVLPFLLMRHRFNDLSYLALATAVTASVASVRLAARALVPPDPWRARDFVAGLLGAVLSVAIGLGFIVWQGSALGPTLHSMFVLPASFAGVVGKRGMPLGMPQVIAAVAGLGAAAWYAGMSAVRDRAWASGALVVLKIAFGVLTIRHDVTAIVAWGPALAWVALVPLPGQTFAAQERLWREITCSVAALQVLQVFPVPGSQQAIGTLLLLPLGLLCLADVADAWERVWPGRIRAAVPVAVLAVLAVVDLGRAANTEWRRYRAGSPLHAAGAERMRLSEGEAALYQWLVDNVRESPDSFFCTMTPHSLHFWTERRPLTLAVTGHGWPAFPEVMQRDLMTLYEGRPDVLAVDFDKPALSPRAKMEIPFYRMFFAAYTPFVRAERWTLYTHRDSRRRWSPLGCSYETPATRALLGDVLASEPGTYPPLPATLTLLLTEAQVEANAAVVQVVDLDAGRILADSRDATHPVEVLDADGVRLLPVPDGATPDLAGRARQVLRLELGAPPREPPVFPAVRFLDARGRRLFTLPIAMTRVEEPVPPRD